MKGKPIHFHLNRSFRLPNRTALKIVLTRLMEREKKPWSSLDYIFCDDRFLLDINTRFLNHDDLTDIISFELADAGMPTEGEIYISVDRVRENAREMQIGFLQELYRVIFHGALHLTGQSDKRPADRKKMREKEDEYLAMLNREIRKGST